MKRNLAKRSVAKKSRIETRLQPRDRKIIWFVGSHGYVTMPQLQLFAFAGVTDCGYETVSDQAVYRRLKKLCDAGFLIHERTWYGDHGIYRITKAGLSLVDLDLKPARLDRRDYDHDLRVVDLALELTDLTGEGWITERRIRSRIKPGESIGRVPDGLLLGPGGERWAIELEISGKETRRYREAMARYADRHRKRIPDGSPDRDLEAHLDDYIESGGQIDGVAWYFFTPGKRGRAQRAANGIISDRDYDYHPTGHLRFEFSDANDPYPPILEKWSMQVESDREAHQERQREEQRHQREEREKAAYREANSYLNDEERKRVRLFVTRQLDGAASRQTYEDRLREATLEAATAKWEKEEKKQQRKDAVKGWILGR